MSSSTLLPTDPIALELLEAIDTAMLTERTEVRQQGAQAWRDRLWNEAIHHMTDDFGMTRAQAECELAAELAEADAPAEAVLQDLVFMQRLILAAGERDAFTTYLHTAG